MLVSDLMEQGNEEFSCEKVDNYYPDPENWSLEDCRNYLSDRGISTPTPDPWDLDEKEEFLAAIEEVGGDSEEFKRKGVSALRDELIRLTAETSLEEWQNEVRDNAEPAEVYEWYRVTSWLARQLDNIGECVLDNSYGTWWGRTATGQSLLMDGTLQQIATQFA